MRNTKESWQKESWEKSAISAQWDYTFYALNIIFIILYDSIN